MEETFLVTLLQKGNATAQRKVFDTYVSKVHSICLRYVQQQQDADLLTSEAFTKVFAHCKKFKYLGEGSLFAWISKIAVNECLMFIRKHKKDLIYFQEEIIAEPIEINIPVSNLTYVEIMTHIHQLPIGYRTVFNLFVFEGMSHIEIAKVLNISVSTSKTQLFKAKRQLQSSLKKLGYG